MGDVPSLTMAEARQRAELLRVQAYELDVDLTGASGADRFRSTTVIRFAANADTATFVEVRPGRLESARLNGAELDPESLVDGRLPLTGLREQNELTVIAEFGYSRSSAGMHRFVDPADGNTYVYAQPSIAEAPGFMACFDQPDLKAPVRLRVTADPQWWVRSNGAGSLTDEGVWEFAPTAPLATYLITLAAGPYHGFQAEHDGIPLGLFARASLAERLSQQAGELFELTAACLDRYHRLFGVRYPFEKYDQVFAPEFSWGAMEFPGCVLIRDELVFRGSATDAERQRRAVLVAHEMAHMWFGNLVTMRWWDDLWLNESFADYLGWRVVSEATQWRHAWAGYGIGRKVWGSAADQRPTTHPVAATEVPDTDAALSNFDGISYAKGSAVLRQLVAWVGEEPFWTGLRRYFDAHRFGNATLADLLRSLSEASGQDLSGWADQWLRRSGVDLLWPEAVTDTDGHYQQVLLHREPADPEAARPHRLWVAAYREDGDTLLRRDRALVDLEPTNGRTAVTGLTGAPAGLLVINDGDLTYAKTRLEPPAVEALAVTLPRVADPVARVLLWRSAWDACRDAQLPAGRLLAVAVAALRAEPESAVFEAILETSAGVVADIYLPPPERPVARAALAQACQSVLAGAESGSSLQLAAARGLIRCAGPADVERLEAWLAGEDVPEGLPVDADMRWAALERLVVLDAAGSERIAAEQARDPSERGAQAAIRCRASRPEPAAKAEAWKLIMTDAAASNRMLVAAAEGFWRPEQEELTSPYVRRFFAEIGATSAWRSGQLLPTVATAAFPRYAVDPATLAAAGRALESGGLHPLLHRALADATDDLRRAYRARSLAGSDAA